MSRDYTGVAVWQLANVFNRLHKGNIERTAERIPPRGMDSRDLKKIIMYQETRFAGLHTADRILLGIDENITALSQAGEIVIIPAPNRYAPYKMAEDEFWALDLEPTEEEFEARARELAALRDVMLAR